MSVILTSNNTNKHYGIEVASSLSWEHWEPGGEYTKQITLKNVNLKTKKLKYRIASTRFFTTRYPQPIVLSSGTSISLPITFRPQKKDTYEDFIEFLTKEGEFRVPMKAILPEAQLKLPEKIEFGMCAVQDQISKEFNICNTSKLQTTFQLHCEAPFVLAPSSGTLAPRTKCKIIVNFKPQGAFVYEENAVCVFGKDKEEKLEKTLKLEGIGKFSHIGIKDGSRSSGDDVVLDYGEVGVGEVIEKTIEIINYTAVQAPFEVRSRQEEESVVEFDRSFTCSCYHGVVPASGSMKVKLLFRPENVNMSYVENFEVVPIGGTSKSTIKCVGVGKGANLSIESRSINFGVAALREEVTRSFKLKNSSSLPAVYQFQTDPVNSVFKVDEPSGQIMGKSTTTVIVKFVPTKPIVYYKKLVCLIHNQEPLGVEMFGTCCTDEIKPAVLSRQHLINYKAHVERGISRFSPEHILQLVGEDKIHLDEADGTLKIVDEELDASVDKPSSLLNPYEEFFNDGSDGDVCMVTPHICLDVRNIDFGKCKDNVIVQKTLNVSNRTHGKVSCNWIISEASNFSVLPVESDIGPLSTISFTVIFRPNSPAKFYSCQLEAFVFYKSMRDHRLVDDKFITPPWCLTATVTGHTFPKNFETYLPVCTWDRSTMVFPPATSLEQSVYRTCLLKNNGHNPIHYSFDEDDAKIFSCKPSVSLLRDHYQIIVFRMSPMEPGTLRKNISCILNDTEKYKVNFKLAMTTEVPQVVISPSDFVYFKPTCLGNKSHQMVSVRNISRVPLHLKWKISEVDDNVLKVCPRECVVRSNEIQQHDWSFTPSLRSKHLFKAKLYVTVDGSDESEVQRYVLRCIGEGQSGTISCDESSITLGDTIVGERVSKTIRLHNDSNCSLMYQLHVQQTASHSSDGTSVESDDESILQLDHYEGLIPSSSNHVVELSVAPKHQLLYNCTISYSLKGLQQDKDEGVETSVHQLCEISVKGVYPLFFISDIRGGGCMQHHSKKYLWDLFHLSQLNHLLTLEPCAKELQYDISSRHSTRRRMPVSTEAVNEFNFGSSTLNNLPCIMYLNLENRGASTTQWTIKYPTDLQLEMEAWADPGQLDDDELHEMYVMNSKLFTVHPRGGKIQPGHSQTIVFEYRHDSLGTHQLPILFKLLQGREIRINLVGSTLPADISALHLISTHHIFQSVSIGTLEPPLQMYTLHNGSGQTVKFKFDTSVLDHVQKENYHWRIFDCLTGEGEVGPFQSINTAWLFSPIEARSYHVDVPLQISDGDTHVISFTGVGIDPHYSCANEDLTVAADALTEVMSKQLIIVPEQLLKLSAESLTFGDIPLYTESSQLIFLTNLSDEKVISFSWNVNGPGNEVGIGCGSTNVLLIQPSTGYLNPKEKKMCKVSVSSKGPPSIHDIDVTCTVTDETLMSKYKSELQQWYEKQEELKHLFVIRDVPDIKNNGKIPRTPSGKLKSLPTGVTPSDVDLRKYDALPPIKSGEGRYKRRVVEEEVECDVKKPVPPESQVVHLNVNVTYHMVEGFRKQYDINTHFVQRYPLTERSTEQAPASKEEFSTIETILSMLVKDVIDDQDFMRDLDRLKNEPIPYFNMIPKEEEIEEERVEGGGGMEDIETVNGKKFDPVKISVLRSPSDTTVGGVDGEVVDIIQTDGDAIMTSQEGEGRIKMTTEADLEYAKQMNQRQDLKRDDEFRNILNEVLENTLYNILCEADHGEISLTNRPRIIVLPPTDVAARASLSA